MAKIKLKDYCKKNSISYITGYRWFKAGNLPGATQTESGTILVDDDFGIAKEQIQNDSLSFLLKKVVEFSKNNSTIEDFAAYMLNTFDLKIKETVDDPLYTRKLPDSETVQAHFRKFIPDKAKPQPCNATFDAVDELVDSASTLSKRELVDRIKMISEQPENSVEIIDTSNVTFNLDCPSELQNRVKTYDPLHSDSYAFRRYEDNTGYEYIDPQFFKSTSIVAKTTSNILDKRLGSGFIKHGSIVEDNSQENNLPEPLLSPVKMPQRRGRKPTKKAAI
jgi:hypothetical protein